MKTITTTLLIFLFNFVPLPKNYNYVSNKEDLEKIYENNLEEYLEPYKVGIDKDELKKLVLDNSSTGHDIINKLSSEIPKLVFKKLQGDVNESK